MDGSQSPCGGNRRRFLKTTAATGAALASADNFLAMADAPAASTIPLVTLGKTGQKVTRLGMGSSISGIDRSHVQNCLFAGVRYIDTSESYKNTVAEKVIGEVLERTNMRKDVYLVSKCNKYQRPGRRGAQGLRDSPRRQPRTAQDRPRRLLLHPRHPQRQGGDPGPAWTCSATPASRPRSRR